MKLEKEKLNYIIFFILILIGSKGNYYVLSDLMLISYYFLVLYLFCISENFKKYKNHYAILIIIYFGINIIYTLEFEYIELFSTIKTFLKISIGLFISLLLKEKIFSFYEQIISKLSLITIPFYIFQCIDINSLSYILKKIESIFPYLNLKGESVTNIFIFTLNQKGNIESIYRNSGFAWEPKGFANMLILAIIINLFKFKFKINKNFIILLICLLTTFSTTAYVVGFISIISLILFNITNKIYGLFLVIFSIFIGYFVTTLPFVYNKIITELDSKEKIEAYQNDESDFKRRSMGRFGSLKMDYQDFQEKPFLGIGMQEYERTQNKNTFLVRVNGLSDLISRFGLIGIIIFIIGYYNFSNSMTYIFNTKGTLIIFLTLLLLNFSSNLILNPLWLSFQFISIDKIKKNE
jgi:hypothetical protein